MISRCYDLAMRLSLREFIGLVTIAALAIALVTMIARTRSLQIELISYRSEVGYLEPTTGGEIAAARSPWDGPLTWKFRIRVPDEKPRYRFSYGTKWPRGKSLPQWYGAIPIEPGESRVTVRILEDPRDNLWKVSAIVASPSGTRRMGTVLPPEQVEIFRGSHQQLRRGIDRVTVTAKLGETIRMLDQCWLVGEGALMLSGDSPSRSDQIGVYGELQPDLGTL